MSTSDLTPVPGLNIDWENDAAFVSKHFTVREAIWLPTWNRLALAGELTGKVCENLVKTLFPKMDDVRDWAALPMIAHVAFRPAPYNAQIGGAPNSAHIQGLALDFHFQGAGCEFMRQRILSEGILDKLELRMEDNSPEAGWIHLDCYPPGPSGRFFRP